MAKKVDPVADYLADPMRAFELDYLQTMLGNDIQMVPARVFCRRTHQTSTYDEKKKQHIYSGPRTMIGGATIGDIMQPESIEDQLLLCELIIVPRQIYTVKKQEDSPAAGMRMDQVLTSGYCLDPKYWDRRLK